MLVCRWSIAVLRCVLFVVCCLWCAVFFLVFVARCVLCGVVRSCLLAVVGCLFVACSL